MLKVPSFPLRESLPPPPKVRDIHVSFIFLFNLCKTQNSIGERIYPFYLFQQASQNLHNDTL